MSSFHRVKRKRRLNDHYGELLYPRKYDHTDDSVYNCPQNLLEPDSPRLSHCQVLGHLSETALPCNESRITFQDITMLGQLGSSPDSRSVSQSAPRGEPTYRYEMGVTLGVLNNMSIHSSILASDKVYSAKIKSLNQGQLV